MAAKKTNNKNQGYNYLVGAGIQIPKQK